MLEALEPTQDPGWVLRYEGYNVLSESALESRFALISLRVRQRFLGHARRSLRQSRPDLGILARA